MLTLVILIVIVGLLGLAIYKWIFVAPTPYYQDYDDDDVLDDVEDAVSYGAVATGVFVGEVASAVVETVQDFVYESSPELEESTDDEPEASVDDSSEVVQDDDTDTSTDE